MKFTTFWATQYVSNQTPRCINMFEQFGLEVASSVSLVNLINSICGGKVSQISIWFLDCFLLLFLLDWCVHPLQKQQQEWDTVPIPESNRQKIHEPSANIKWFGKFGRATHWGQQKPTQRHSLSSVIRWILCYLTRISIGDSTCLWIFPLRSITTTKHKWNWKYI